MQQQTLPTKPPFAAPCNGCGACCKRMVCAPAISALGTSDGPCPALETEHNRAWCGMLRDPKKYVPEFKGEEIIQLQLLLVMWNGYGAGCGMRDEPTQPQWECIDETNLPLPLEHTP